MRIGLVSPYAWDVPGGVQFHIRDLAIELVRRGHHVSILSPASHLAHGDLPDNVTWAGPTVPITFNGSVARLSFGPRVMWRTREWLEEGNFDVVHVHEPTTPSASMLAAMLATVPVVATFHSSMERSLTREWTSGAIRGLVEKLAARIAVSAEARRTLIEHHGGDAVIIPNGVDTAQFRTANTQPAWRSTPQRPVVVFLGRLEEARKGLPIFAQAIPVVLRQLPGARFLIAGRGDAQDIRLQLATYGDSVEFVGEISDDEKESLLKGASIYVAPQTGGESFGIVLVEAMSAGCVVVASDLEAFRDVLADGQAGALFPTGDGQALANVLVELLEQPQRLNELGQAGLMRSVIYDWRVVTNKIEAVYQSVLGKGSADIPERFTLKTALNDLWGRFEREEE